jgi:hypothetical protein
LKLTKLEGFLRTSFVTGHDFSRAENGKKCRALAPAVIISGDLQLMSDLSQ